MSEKNTENAIINTDNQKKIEKRDKKNFYLFTAKIIEVK